MTGPERYVSVASFFDGARFGGAPDLEGLQAFVTVRTGDEVSGWSTALLHHASFSVEEVRLLLRGGGSEALNERAIGAVFDTLEDFFARESEV